jgi:3-oxoacyl-[acyl-carrier-protein] synthase I
MTSACATSAHAIGHAADLIALGRQDVMFAGGGEDLHWSLSMLFDAMGALSTRYNDTPERASRTYDADRDGFVISGGGGILVLEALDQARQRGATVWPKWPVSVPPPTGRTWSCPAVRVRCAACGRRWKG